MWASTRRALRGACSGSFASLLEGYARTDFTAAQAHRAQPSADLRMLVDGTLAAYERSRISGATVLDAVQAARDVSRPFCQRNPDALVLRPTPATPPGNPYGSISDCGAAAGLTVSVGPLTSCATAFAVAKAYAAADV